MNRLKIISRHLSPRGSSDTTRDLQVARCGSAARGGGASGDDVVVVHGRRTAIGKAKRGAFKVQLPDTLVLDDMMFGINLKDSQADCALNNLPLKPSIRCSKWKN